MINAILSGEHFKNRRWIEGEFEKLPRRFQPEIARRYAEKYRGSFRAANEMLFSALDVLGHGRANLAGNESDLRDFAKARADECLRVACRYIDADEALAAMEAIAQRNGIEPPGGDNVTKQGRRARLLCAKWWRRALRCYVARKVEAAAITLGLVHRRAGLYASNETVARRAGQRKRNRETLEALIATNMAEPEGQRNEYTLAELSDLGVSNPEIRRMELMTRLAGFDEIAVAENHAAEFYTITAPSKYHARLDKSGAENPKYNGATPRETQAYLCKVWARARAKLHREGIRIYGFRVCEPHHDGTPHWHAVLFMEAQHAGRVREIVRDYALEEDGEETGAAAHRCTVKAIDRSKGNAAGYLAKYIAKNIDGFGVGADFEGGGDTIDTAKRVDAWASCWGIRQFQQIGGAPVTVWRELRRMNAADQTDAYMHLIVSAADAGKWAIYTVLQGGPLSSRKELSVTSYKVNGLDIITGEITLNAYGEIAGPAIKGVMLNGQIFETRLGDWVFERRGAAASPWSSVNNYTGGKNEIAGKSGEIGKGNARHDERPGGAHAARPG